MFYVYLLLDPTEFYLPFYIGKGKGERWRDHLSERPGKTTNERKTRRIMRLREAGLAPAVMIWADSLDEESAYDLEALLIARFGRKGFEKGGVLENIQVDARPPGFHGKTHSAASRRKIGEAHRGKLISSEHRAAISALRKGVPKSEEVRLKISAGMKGIVRSPEHAAALGATKKGKPLPEDVRSAISASLKGRPKSAAAVENMRAARRLRAQRERQERAP